MGFKIQVDAILDFDYIILNPKEARTQWKISPNASNKPSNKQPKTASDEEKIDNMARKTEIPEPLALQGIRGDFLTWMGTH